MNYKTAILYSTVDGQTLKICNKLRDVFKQYDQNVELFSIDDFNGDITQYDKLIIGASIRYGVHNKKIIDFINTNKKQLDSIKTAFFSVNLVAITVLPLVDDQLAIHVGSNTVVSLGVEAMDTGLQFHVPAPSS